MPKKTDQFIEPIEASFDDVAKSVLNHSLGAITNQNKNKVLHLHDHLQQVAAKVGIPVDIYEKEIPWTSLGVDKAGNTTSLVMESNIIKDLSLIHI